MTLREKLMQQKQAASQPLRSDTSKAQPPTGFLQMYSAPEFVDLTVPPDKRHI